MSAVTLGRGRGGGIQLRLRTLLWLITGNDRSFAWLMPWLAVAVLMVWLHGLQPLIFSYTGLALTFSATVPLVIAVMAQLFIIACGDIDLSIGSYIGLVNVVAATTLVERPLLGVLVLLALLLAYVAMGFLIHWRGAPSIIVTLGMSFVWLGIGVVIMPTPRGSSPAFLSDLMNWAPPQVPGCLVMMAILAVVAWWLLNRTRFGVRMRATGNSAPSVSLIGGRTLAIRVGAYAVAGVLAICSGLALTGITTAGDPYVAQSYVVLSIAGVIVGGGSFRGGDVSPVGAVAGAIVLTLVGTVMQLQGVNPNWQVGVQGLLLVAILSVRGLGRRLLGGKRPSARMEAAA
jgi:ribose transport system permease protein